MKLGDCNGRRMAVYTAYKRQKHSTPTETIEVREGRDGCGQTLKRNVTTKPDAVSNFQNTCSFLGQFRQLCLP